MTNTCAVILTLCRQLCQQCCIPPTAHRGRLLIAPCSNKGPAQLAGDQQTVAGLSPQCCLCRCPTRSRACCSTRATDLSWQSSLPCQSSSSGPASMRSSSTRPRSSATCHTARAWRILWWLAQASPLRSAGTLNITGACMGAHDQLATAQFSLSLSCASQIYCMDIIVRSSSVALRHF